MMNMAYLVRWFTVFKHGDCPIEHAMENCLSMLDLPIIQHGDFP